MKFLFGILALLLVTKNCDQKKSEKDTEKTEIVNNQESSKQQLMEYVIEYSAMTRGSFKEIRVDKSTISIKNKRGEESNSQDCSAEIWEDIMSKLESIDLKNLSKLEAPTQHRYSDGAAIGRLKVILKDTTYQSSEFDHGHPPKEIKSLCDKLIELSSGSKKE